jgi:hypothetical protein
MTETHEGRGIRPDPVAVFHERGTLREMTDRLRELARGYDHMGKPKKEQDYLRAAEGLEAGSFSVRVGVTTYSVVAENE